MLRKKQLEESSKWQALYEQAREDIKELREQVSKLQDALIAKESPRAYEQLVTERDPEADKKREVWATVEEENRLVGRYLEELEKPLFRDGEDLSEALAGMIGAPELGKESLHSNEES